MGIFISRKIEGCITYTSHVLVINLCFFAVNRYQFVENNIRCTLYWSMPCWSQHENQPPVVTMKRPVVEYAMVVHKYLTFCKQVINIHKYLTFCRSLLQRINTYYVIVLYMKLHFYFNILQFLSIKIPTCFIIIVLNGIMVQIKMSYNVTSCSVSWILFLYMTLKFRKGEPSE